MPASAASLSDIVGLAFRMPPGLFAATPWDVLLASAGSGLLTRVVLQPVTSWSGASFSSVMPLGYEGGVWWLRARMASGMDGDGLSLDTITDRIGRGGVQFDVEQANGTGGFRPLGRLSRRPGVRRLIRPNAALPARVQLWPGWLTDFRRIAYRRSQAEEHRGHSNLRLLGGIRRGELAHYAPLCRPHGSEP